MSRRAAACKPAGDTTGVVNLGLTREGRCQRANPPLRIIHSDRRPSRYEGTWRDEGWAGLFRKTKASYDGGVLSIHPHALKHGVDADDIRAAFASGFDGVMPEDDDPPRWLMIGFDTAGRMIELVVIAQSGGGYLAIHAMRARKGSIRQIRKAREGR